MEKDGLPFQRRLCVDGYIKELSLTLGQRRVMCSFVVVGELNDDSDFFCDWQ